MVKAMNIALQETLSTVPSSPTVLEALTRAMQPCRMRALQSQSQPVFFLQLGQSLSPLAFNGMIVCLFVMKGHLQFKIRFFLIKFLS